MLTGYRNLLLLTFFLLVGGSGGCSRGEEAAGRWNSAGSWPPFQGLKEVSLGEVACVGRNDQVLLMVWTNFLGGINLPTSLSGDGLKEKGELKTPTVPRPTIEFDSKQEGQGQVKIDDNTYDLAKGRTLFIRHQGGALTVLQTDHDPKKFLQRTDGAAVGQAGAHYGLDSKTVDRFVRTDAEFRKFFNVKLAKDAP